MDANEYQNMVIAKNARNLEIKIEEKQVEIDRLKEELRITRADRNELRAENKAMLEDLSRRSV